MQIPGSFLRELFRFEDIPVSLNGFFVLIKPDIFHTHFLCFFLGVSMYVSFEILKEMPPFLLEEST